MAIINTFSRCLESAYLLRDAEAPARVADLLTLAGDRLEAAVNLQEAPKSDAADRCLLSYESMFACLRALVYAEGFREAGLQCLLLACEELYVKTGRLDPAHLLAFERAQGLKLTPDEALEAASALSRRTLELLGS